MGFTFTANIEVRHLTGFVFGLKTKCFCKAIEVHRLD
jgi:hypothetical protein